MTTHLQTPWLTPLLMSRQLGRRPSAKFTGHPCKVAPPMAGRAPHFTPSHNLKRRYNLSQLPRLLNNHGDGADQVALCQMTRARLHLALVLALVPVVVAT